jgi:hypothetical protein
MDGRPSSTMRWARLAWPHRNPLARGVDRVEGTVVVAAVLVALLLVPVMLVFGSIAHANMVHSSERQAGTRHAAVAVLTEDAPVGHGDAMLARSAVPARWTLPGGATRTGLVQASDGLRAGARIPIWLDRAGRVVGRPATSSDAVAAGVLVAVFGWLTAAGLLAAAVVGVHGALNRRRYRVWGEGWASVESDWNSRR